MNILITGANGFIGRALCDKLIADGYQVCGAVRGAAQMTALPSGVEGASSADPLAAFREVNVEGTKRLARQAAEAGVKRLVYISSVKVNGERTLKIGNRIEEREDRKENRENRIGDRKRENGERWAAFSEKDVPEPQDPYAVSKWEAEQGLLSIAEATGLEVVIIRPPLVYGPGVKANFLRLFKIVERGIPLPFAKIDNRRSFIYLDNMIDAIITCINHPGVAGQTFLISDGEDVSTPELIRRISSVLGKPARLFSSPSFLMRLAGKLLGKSAAIDRLLGSLTIDSTKIRKELGWEPPYTMEQGIRETAKWYQKAGKLIS